MAYLNFTQFGRYGDPTPTLFPGLVYSALDLLLICLDLLCLGQCAQNQVKSRFAFKLVKCDLNTEICTCEVPELAAREVAELAVRFCGRSSSTFP